ncbi:MAG: putative bifunctional diguanylate cyclase/phosphodiesterase [Gaiellaceae bacterium]
MTIRSRRHLSSTFAWALSLAALVLASSLLTGAFHGRADYITAVLVVFSFLAAATGVLLNGRLTKAAAAALRDPLTGLPNRVLLDDRIEQALRRSRRTGERFTLIVIDLDGFKDVNDVRGHKAGDSVLRTLAHRFATVVRESDTVARVGGDEFVVLSTETANETATTLVRRLRHALRQPFSVDGATIEIDGSIGWAVFPTDGGTSDELLSRADGQMYATKRDVAADSVFIRRGVDPSIVRDVERALAQKELMVVYQPILDLATGATLSAEALIRRVLADGVLVPPSEFVPHVERTPLARELTFLVLADALTSAELWSSTGHDLGVSINIPYRLLDDPQFADGLETMLRSVDVVSTPVTLEVVPAGPGTGVELDDEVLSRFGALGVRLSLDDGGRTASFAALRVLPLDELKVDAGLVAGVGVSDTDGALVRGLIDIGHALDLTVVAEGVETQEAWRLLGDWGCDYAQGFYVARPRRASELVEWLDDARWTAVA